MSQHAPEIESFSEYAAGDIVEMLSELPLFCGEPEFADVSRRKWVMTTNNCSLPVTFRSRSRRQPSLTRDLLRGADLLR